MMFVNELDRYLIDGKDLVFSRIAKVLLLEGW